MRKLLARRGHALVDCCAVLGLALAVPAARLEGPGRCAALAFVPAIALGIVTTRTPLGLLPRVPFRWHGRVEIASIAAQVALPWLAGFADRPRERNFLLGLAAVNLLTWLATDWTAPPQEVRAGLPGADR
ncbi:hypothetical protein HNR42_000612 [Deinobacterium chartae]|uniref:Uncharacterized protein n=1 Tax=Deinobacterium chartae TaxID=521158 RepID=A0A841HZ02_9DEIO|nr:hypothetical protein [Deinobacterium chartae]MBB6097198.1 hypothetical protein [Deinobacterium chartae]